MIVAFQKIVLLLLKMIVNNVKEAQRFESNKIYNLETENKGSNMIRMN